MEKAKKNRANKKPAAPKRRALGDDHLHILRLLAEARCVLSAEPLDLRKVAADKDFDGITVQQLRAWSDAGKWNERRAEHLQRLRQQVQSKLAVALRRSRLQQLGAMRQIEHQGMLMLSDPNLTPKNGWESMANAVTRLSERIESMQASIGRDAAAGLVPVTASLTQGDVPADMMPELSDDEARAAARAVVEMRRSQGAQVVVQ